MRPWLRQMSAPMRECGAWRQYLQRSDMLTDLFCRFTNNTRELLLKISATTVPTADVGSEKEHVRNGFSGRRNPAGGV